MTRRSAVGTDVTGVSHVGLQVRDLARSLAFYRDLLGLSVVAEWDRGEPYVQELVGYPGVVLHAAILAVPGSDTVVELLEYRNVAAEPIDPATAHPGTMHLCLYVTQLDALHVRLAAAGVRSVSAPVTPTVGPNRGGRAVCTSSTRMPSGSRR
jgi:lactoylglutathione lyase